MFNCFYEIESPLGDVGDSQLAEQVATAVIGTLTLLVYCWFISK